MTGFPPVEDWWRLASAAVWLPTSREMAALDRKAVSSGAICERALIENAGREVAKLLHARWPEGPVLALAGSGHNGADALVALRCLHAWGRRVRAVRCGSRAPAPDVLAGWDLSLEDPGSLSEHLSDSAVVIDGLLGTGLEAAPREPTAALISQVNASGLPIVAVDGPSGADFTTGRVPGACVRASLTVSLGWPNLGLLQFPARRYCGDLLAVEIGFPPDRDEAGSEEIRGAPAAARAITARWVAESMLPRRTSEAHKGRAGYLTLVAGQEGMAGAAVLASRAAVRGGVGILRVVSDPANREILQGAVPEAIFVPWDDSSAVAESVAWAHAVVAGPGMGRGPARRALVERILECRGARPALLDADALNAWEGAPEELAKAVGGKALLTPHPGELARLIESPIQSIQADRTAAARQAAVNLGCTVLLKGAPSLVAEEGHILRVATVLTPALAAGGTGDVLSGLAGAYLAAGSSPLDAASAALLISGLAALSAPGAIGHSSADLPESIPRVRAELDRLVQRPSISVLFASPCEVDGSGWPGRTEPSSAEGRTHENAV
ncbi:MAG: NAD(P)H-hydrate dehydratase [Gemmatimonadota bacterium]